MSKKNKKKEKVRPPELKPNATQDDVIKYLFYLLKRFCGYSCVSISKPSKEQLDKNQELIVPITAHKCIPSFDNITGRYTSTKDVVVEYICLSRKDFEGFILDRNGVICIGDPFSTVPQKVDDDKKVDLSNVEEEQL